MESLFSKYKDGLLGRVVDKYSKFPLLVRLGMLQQYPVHVHPSDKAAESLGETKGVLKEIWLVF